MSHQVKKALKMSIVAPAIFAFVMGSYIGLIKLVIYIIERTNP